MTISDESDFASLLDMADVTGQIDLAAQKKTRHQIRVKAMDLLARREYSKQELQQRLLQPEFAADLVAEILADLAREGLQSDERFVESFISSRRRRGQGPMRIQAELRQRGISDQLIADWLDMRDSCWFKLVRDVHDKRFSGQQPETLAERARQQRFLNYRGFTTEQIQFLFKSDMEEY